MDVDASAGHESRQIIAQYLHVACQHDQVRAGFLDDRLDLRFLLRLCVLCHRQMMERDISDQRYGQRFARMVADDAHDIHVQFANAPAIQKIAQAMVELADQQQNLLPFAAATQAPFHAALLRHIGEGRTQPVHAVVGRFKLHPHEKAVGQLVVKLLGVGNIAALLRQKAGNIGHQAWPVVALQGQGANLGHIASPLKSCRP